MIFIAAVGMVLESIFLGVDFFYLLPSRFMGIMGNQVLIAVPLFIFMGLMLEKSGIIPIYQNTAEAIK